MTGRQLVRGLYSWATGVGPLRRPLATIRSHPRVRAYARRHVDVLLARGTTWANVDGALRLLAEDPSQHILFGPWPGDAAGELLYWAPFVRWALEHFSLEPAKASVCTRDGKEHWYGSSVTAVSRTGNGVGAAVFRAEPVAALVEEYRRGASAPRPLLKRSKHVLLERPAHDDEAPAGPYVAVDLRPSPAFPSSDPNRRAAAGLLEALEASVTVASVDEASSLRAQHSLVAGATGVVCSYSSVALLAALSGVPVIALRSSGGDVVEADLDLAQRVASALGCSLTILDSADLEALRDAVGGR